MGSIFDLEPVISCNEDGVYYTVAKTRGRKKSLQLALQGSRVRRGRQGVQRPGDARSRDAGGRRILPAFKTQLLDFGLAIEGQLTPVLVVHSGPGLIGVGIQRLA